MKQKHTLNFMPSGTFQKKITVTHMVQKDITFYDKTVDYNNSL